MKQPTTLNLTYATYEFTLFGYAILHRATLDCISMRFIYVM